MREKWCNELFITCAIFSDVTLKWWVDHYIHLSCTCSIWADKLHWLNNFVLFSVTDQHLAFSGVTYYLLRFWNLVVNPVDKKHQKGQIRDNYIISLCNSQYKRRWINAIFLQYEYNIKYKAQNLGKGSVNLDFIPGFKLIHISNIKQTLHLYCL